MIDGVEFGALALAHALAVMSPGPDFALVLRQSLVRGQGAAVASAMGIGAGILVHVTYALLGVGWLVQAQPALFAGLKVAGAGYLAWLGWRGLRSRGPTELGGQDGKGVDRGEAWWRGFLTNVLNPKATLFFVALFAVGVDPQRSRWVLAGYGLWMALMTAGWFTLVALALTRPAVRAAFLRGGVWIDRVLGVVFLAFAASLLREF